MLTMLIYGSTSGSSSLQSILYFMRHSASSYVDMLSAPNNQRLK